MPSIIGRKYGIPVIWNNPGCPFEFDGYQNYIAGKVLGNVSFMSVRNQFSYDALINYNANVKVSVDTAFNIKEVFPKWKLKRQVKEQGEKIELLQREISVLQNEKKSFFGFKRC